MAAASSSAPGTWAELFSTEREEAAGAKGGREAAGRSNLARSRGPRTQARRYPEAGAVV